MRTWHKLWVDKWPGKIGSSSLFLWNLLMFLQSAWITRVIRGDLLFSKQSRITLVPVGTVGAQNQDRKQEAKWGGCCGPFDELVGQKWEMGKRRHLRERGKERLEGVRWVDVLWRERKGSSVTSRRCWFETSDKPPVVVSTVCSLLDRECP